MIAGRLGLLLLAAGCAVSRPLTTEERPAAFLQAEEVYLRGDTSAGRLEFEKFRESHAGSLYVPWALYYEGLCLLVEGSPILAIRRLEEARDLFEDPAQKSQAQMAIGDALFLQDRYEEAEKAYVSARGAGGVPADEILYKAGLCARRLGWWEDADRRFGEVVEKYPHGSRVGEARGAMEETDHFFSIATGTFRVRKNADRKAEALSAAGLEPHLQQVSSPAGVLWRVCVGKYPDYRAAKEEMARLSQKGVIPEGHIVP